MNIENKVRKKIQELEKQSPSIEQKAKSGLVNSLNFLINFFGVILVAGTLIKIGAIN